MKTQGGTHIHSATPPTGGGCCCSAPAAAPMAAPARAEASASNSVWLRLAISLVIAGQSMVFGLALNTAEEKPVPGSTVYWLLHGALIASALVVVALLGIPLFKAQWQAIKARRITVEGLFVLSLLGALGGSLVSTFSGQGSIYYEVMAVVLVVYTFGKVASARSREQVMKAAGRLREDFSWAWVRDAQGGRSQLPVAELCRHSSRVAVAPGEPVTVDGTILSGEGFVSETSLTGEPIPVVRRRGDTLLAGSYSVDGSFELRPDKLEGERKLDQVLETVERGRAERPSGLQVQADRLIRWFLPLVVTVSLSTFVVWLLMPGVPWWQALFNAMAVLLVACPCALGLATPIAVWGGLLRIGQLGLTAQSGRVIDSLASADTFVFDKTGTLSEDSLALVDIVTADSCPEHRRWLISAMASAEQGLAHPVARALEDPMHQPVELTERTLVPGRGVIAQVEGHELRIGELDLMGTSAEAFDALHRSSRAEGSAKKFVHVVLDGAPAALVVLDERLREGALSAFEGLVALGTQLHILTGDPNPRWQDIGQVEVISGLSPEDKLARVQSLKGQGRKVVFVGDGINDAGAMTAADSAIAMGAAAGLARSTADAVLPGNDLSSLPEAVKVSRRVRASVRGNMLFAMTYNGIGMTLAALGLLHPVVAALLMVGSSSVVSIRALRSSAPSRSTFKPVSKPSTSPQDTGPQGCCAGASVTVGR